MSTSLSNAEQAVREERERWRAYCKLLCDELKETAWVAFSHGWRSTRFKAGEEAREILGIDQECNDLEPRESKDQ